MEPGDGDEGELLVTDEQLEYALQRIQLRVDTWKPTIEDIQMAAVLAVWDKIKNYFPDPKPGVIRERILSVFRERGIPLQPAVVGMIPGQEQQEP